MLLFVLLGVVFIGAYVFLKQRYAYWEKRNVPHPKPRLLFGNTGPILTMSCMMSDICHKLYQEYKDYAYVGLFNLVTPAVVVRDVELIKAVLIKQFNNFHDNWISVEHNIDPVLAKNPFLIQGEEWKVVRTQLTPQYTVAKLKGMIPLMQGVAKNLTEYIKNQTETKKSNCIEAKELTARYTSDNVMLCAYGLEGKSFVDDVPVAFKVGEEIASSDRFVQVKQIIGLFFPLLRRTLKLTFIGSPVPKVFWDMILGTIKYRDENNIVRKDYLDFIRDLRKPNASPFEITDAYAVAHAFTFFLDAFETSAASATYSLYELAQNLDIQVKAREEIERVLKNHNGTLNHEALLELEYLDNIVSESLRKHPIILFYSRVCTEDCKFPPPGGPGTGDDVIIEKGTQIFLPIYSIHNDPEYYPNPEKFDPNRFTEEVKGTRPKGSFMGFGDGPRICLGRNYAIQQIKVMLAILLSEFEIRMNSKTTIPYKKDRLQVLNVPKDGIFIDFHRRSK